MSAETSCVRGVPRGWKDIADDQYAKIWRSKRQVHVWVVCHIGLATAYRRAQNRQAWRLLVDKPHDDDDDDDRWCCLVWSVGRSHDKLGRVTSHSITSDKIKSDGMRSVEMKWKMIWKFFFINLPAVAPTVACYENTTRLPHRAQWRHSNLWSRYDLHVVGLDDVPCKMHEKRWYFG